MLGTAHAATPGRVVYLVHTLQQLPFGPGAFYPSESGTRLVRRAAAVVTVSRAAQDHLRTWAAIESTLLYPHVYGPGPYPRHRGDAVIMINPCGYKGLAIFLGLADAFPDVRFLAVPTWGTSDEDRTALARRPNIEIAEATDDIDEILVRGRVVVMPSLWDETFGYTAVEAMLRGIPVLAADIGGLTEAKLGVPYSLPVRRIETYAAQAGQGRPTPQIAAQDLRPWLAALRALLTEPDHHADIARRSRAAATAFVESLDAGALESLLLGLRPTVAGPVPGRDGLPADRHRLAALARLSTKER
jgi:glycosyltransferase involved in cell wall biosynthesis